MKTLPAIRAHLLAAATTVIHGDVHTANVVLREGGPQGGGVHRLGTWARRFPFRRCASWLHALGCWEPEARRRHDTLWRVYLDERRVRRPLSDVRVEYWLASASNGLAGAIGYHLAGPV